MAVACRTLACHHMEFFLEFLITVLVADVHPFKDRYRMYSGNLVSALKWKVILWPTDFPQMVAGVNPVKTLPFDAFQSYLLYLSS